jgi:hypothetical protein
MSCNYLAMTHSPLFTLGKAHAANKLIADGAATRSITMVDFCFFARVACGLGWAIFYGCAAAVRLAGGASDLSKIDKYD